ncbi:hypothetical protein EYF80_054960 [Liparis tanakae]|uniref:Uncharacterized protein n=1 Tax=Liparis tanakae TaxID=230148 RepID=A0A4Z2F1N3_9TELE|nr:hypothetical protein EYF80_054960 [Liparis tanakae]
MAASSPTCVNTRFSELRLSRLRTKRMDWKSSCTLALNCSSSMPQVALEYRMRDWTMNLNRQKSVSRTSRRNCEERKRKRHPFTIKVGLE